jgi:prepilin-type processing-associated H-X9-DG protein
MLAEIRTRDNQSDPRGAWAAAISGGSVIAYDMHDFNQGTGCGTKRNSPYNPKENILIDALTPNSSPSGNADQLRECPDPELASLELMPCEVHNGTWTSNAPRSRHQGGVNVAYVDSSVQFISDNIDKWLMARLVSINDGQGEVEGPVTPQSSGPRG